MKTNELLRSCFELGAFLLLSLVSAQTWAFALAWDLESNPSVVGYMVYQGLASGNYTSKLDVGLSSTYAPSNVVGGTTYYFAVTAYNAARAESGFSNEVSATASSSAPVASFGASTTTGTAPLALNFINTSTGTITGNSWTFGDGTTSNNQNPAHVYSTAGSYTVSLTVTGPGGSSTKTKNNYISVTSGSAPITFIQQDNATPQYAVASVPVTFAGAQTAGNLNIVVVGWNDSTAIVNSVTDSKGNVYTRAVGPTLIGGVMGQSIYYAKNIAGAAASANTVTVQFNVAAAYPDIRILEYGGLDPVNPADVVAAGTGTGTTSSTPAAPTTNANDLIFGASVVSTHNTGPGAGFTSRVITQDGGIAEDRIVTTLGSYSATAPMTNGTWLMQMVAFRGAGAGADTIPPTAPTNPVAVVAGSSGINLTWTAATDNVGVTGYRVERCQGAGCTTFAQVAAPAGTSFGDTGLAASTSYSYRVRATDAAGNLGPYSATASATTSALPDTTAPTAPTNPVAAVAGSSGINLTWTAATDNVGVTGYRVERCQGAGCTTFAQVAAPAGTSFGDTGLAASTSYSYRVRATDAAGNLGPYSATASATTSALPDTTAPTAPTNPVAAVAGSSGINLTWTAATDNVGVTGYRVERCQGAGCTTFAQVAAPAGTSFGDTGLAASTSYSYRVRATDAAGNLGPYSATASATTNSASAAIIFIQQNNATPQYAVASVPVTFAGAQTAGNLNIVVVGWNDSTAIVNSVTDSKGNVYTRAVGPTLIGGVMGQSIYYAKNIAGAAASANTVTVQFNVAAAYPDIRILEYGGLDPVNPADVVAAGTGTGTTSSTPAAPTTNANDLIFGASVVSTHNTGPGAGFTSRVITQDGGIAEDRIVTTLGSYSATAPMTNGTWLMQMVAFRKAP